MKTVEPKAWKILLTAGILLAAVLLLGTAPKPEPKFVASAQSLNPAKTSYKAVVKPVVVQRTVRVQSTVEPVESVPATAQPATQATTGGLTGSVGYAIPFGNCINQINPRPNGNPISWPVRSQTPAIGMAALWNYNHVGRIVGIWSNGDLEIAHENYQGGQTRFPRSAFRGFW